MLQGGSRQELKDHFQWPIMVLCVNRYSIESNVYT